MSFTEPLQPVLDKRLPGPGGLFVAARWGHVAVNNWDDQIFPDRETH